MASLGGKRREFRQLKRRILEEGRKGKTLAEIREAIPETLDYYHKVVTQEDVDRFLAEEGIRSCLASERTATGVRAFVAPPDVNGEHRWRHIDDLDAAQQLEDASWQLMRATSHIAATGTIPAQRRKQTVASLQQDRDELRQSSATG